MALENLKRGSLALELRHCEWTGYVFRAKKRALIFFLFFLFSLFSVLRSAGVSRLFALAMGGFAMCHVPWAGAWRRGVAGA